jgi:hypothetical protein
MLNEDLGTKRTAMYSLITMLVASLQCGTAKGTAGAGAAEGSSLAARKSEGDLPRQDFVVFVGRRLQVDEVVPARGEVWFDRKFVARYQVLTVIFGTFAEDEITFTSFDHKAPRGVIPLQKLNEVLLLYVSKVDGEMVHEKYQYDEVYKTRDGRWAGCATPYDAPNHRSERKVHPVDFFPTVEFNVRDLTADETQQLYPSSSFEIRDAVAVCIAGLYAEELFDIRRRGVLKARGIFE